jgi:hypothetical protein
LLVGRMQDILSHRTRPHVRVNRAGDAVMQPEFRAGWGFVASQGRLPGWYWVNHCGPREVAFWDAESCVWWVAGSDVCVREDELIVLSGRLEPPE